MILCHLPQRTIGIGISVLILSLPNLSAVSQRPNAGLLSSLREDAFSRQSEIARTYGNLPLSFELNQGQADPQTRYLMRGTGYTASFRQNETDLLMTKSAAGVVRNAATPADNAHSLVTLLRMRLSGSRANVPISGETQLPGTVNYFTGNDPASWRTNVPTYGRVRYAGVYPGTDLIYYGTEGRLEFDFELAPRSDPKAIRIRFDGSRRIRLDEAGNLIVDTGNGPIRFEKPLLYQVNPDGARQPVEGAFRITGRRTVSFAVHGWDRSLPLVIDPIFDYSTCIGRAQGRGIQVDSAGEAYVIGDASGEMQFPTTPGSFQTSFVGPAPIVVAKFNSTATDLVYATYISGSRDDYAYGLALDTNGNVYITGSTNSTDFPITQGAFQPTNRAANYTAFVTKLNSSGSALVYSTFLGGSTLSAGNGIALDPSGNVYIAGITEDTDFPTTAGAFQATAVTKPMNEINQYSGFAAKLNPGGTALVYSTYLAGHNGADIPNGIAVDSSQSAYVAGSTLSDDFPTTPASFQTSFKGVEDAFVAKLNASGSALIYSTLLGGADPANLGSTEGSAIAVDASGSAYITGDTDASDFPTTPGVIQPVRSGISLFATKVNNSGSALVYSTFLGGTQNAFAGGAPEGRSNAITVDANGDAFLAGATSSTDFPVTPGAYETENLSQLSSANWGGFVTELNPDATAFLYSTYLSGNGDQSGEGCDCIYGIALDPQDNVYVTGRTVSADFPVTSGVIGTSGTLFVTKFNAAAMKSLPVPTVSLTTSQNPQECGQPVTFTATVQSTSGPIPTGTIGFSIAQYEPSDGSGIGPGPWNNVPLDASGTARYKFITSLCDQLGIFVGAYYLGDANNAPGGYGIIQQLTPIPTTMTLSSSATSVKYGDPLTLTVTVLDNFGKPVPGEVDFIVGNFWPYMATLDSAGQATWNVAQTTPYPLPAGTDTITVNYPEYGLPFGLGYTQSSASVTVNITGFGVTSAPTFTPAAGTYSTAQQVSLSDTMNPATIYYTTDGSTPSVQSSAVYSPSAPISISQTQTIQAIAVAPGYTPSPVASAAYTIPPNFYLYLMNDLLFSSSQAVTARVTVQGEFGFDSTVTLSCSGMPTGTSCSFSPATVNPTPQQVAVASTLTLSANTAARSAPASLRSWHAFVLAVLFGTLGLRRRRGWIGPLSIISAILALGSLGACGGGGNSGTGAGGGGGDGGGQNPVTAIVTIIGTSGSLQSTAKVTVTYTP